MLFRCEESLANGLDLKDGQGEGHGVGKRLNAYTYGVKNKIEQVQNRLLTVCSRCIYYLPISFNAAPRTTETHQSANIPELRAQCRGYAMHAPIPCAECYITNNIGTATQDSALETLCLKEKACLQLLYFRDDQGPGKKMDADMSMCC